MLPVSSHRNQERLKSRGSGRVLPFAVGGLALIAVGVVFAPRAIETLQTPASTSEKGVPDSAAARKSAMGTRQPNARPAWHATARSSAARDASPQIEVKQLSEHQRAFIHPTLDLLYARLASVTNEEVREAIRVHQHRLIERARGIATPESEGK